MHTELCLDVKNILNHLNLFINHNKLKYLSVLYRFNLTVFEYIKYVEMCFNFLYEIKKNSEFNQWLICYYGDGIIMKFNH